MSGKDDSKLIRSDTAAELKYPSTQDLEYITGDLSRRRDAVLDDFPVIPEIDLPTFFESFLPPLSSGINVGSIIDLLFLSQRIRQGPEDFHWDVFATKPTDSDVAEGATFDKLMEIYDEVIEKAAISPEIQTTKLCLNPNKAPFSDRTHNTRPDGYMVSTRPCMGADNKECWQDLAVTMEFKKKNNNVDRIDNMQKQVFSMQQLMAYDPCRRFTFGLTIENTDVRLWFCSRSMLVVSDNFDLNAEFPYLIHAFLSFTYASKADLGWDETMKPKIIGGKIQYEIKVGDDTYETQGKPLSNLAARSIVGRATRVYKVKKLNDDAENTRVLKDVWLAKDRRPEHTIQKEILEDIKRKLGENDKNKIEKHLFTPVHHYTVQVETKDKGWIDDDTHDVILRKAQFSTAERYDIVRAATNVNHIVVSQGQTPHSSDYVATRAPPDHKDINMTHRYHYRIVYEELAVPLYNLDRVSSIFHLFYELVEVLHIFHRAGWIHRDLSVGNIFLYQNKCFKLGDLEFAKRMGTDGEHDVRTGTLDFMACEVERQKYLYVPDGQPRPKFFYHNSLHELESVWWLAIWCLFFHHPSESAPEGLTGQRDALDALFPRRLNDTGRSEIFYEDEKFDGLIRDLHENFRHLGSEVEELRIKLKHAYKSFEARLVEQDAVENFSRNSLNDIHRVFITKFGEIWTKYKANDIKLVRLHSLKREYTATEDSPDVKRHKPNKEAVKEYVKAIAEGKFRRPGVKPPAFRPGRLPLPG